MPYQAKIAGLMLLGLTQGGFVADESAVRSIVKYT